MTLAPLTFCLPPLLGYLLFVCIGGRLAPFAVPDHLADRPSWALGLWTGSVVAMVTFVGVCLAWTTSPGHARTLLAPGAWALAALLAPGLAGWLAYRGRIARALDLEARDRRQEASGTDAEPLTDPVSPPTEPRPATPGVPVRVSLDEATETQTLVATFLDIGGPEHLDIPDIPVASGDSPSRGAPGRAQDAIEREGEGTSGVLGDEFGSLRLALRAEKRLREEIETHLRITRRAFARLEKESRVRENAATEVKAARESARRTELADAILVLERKVRASRDQARRSSESKAKAVSAATRSLVLARQAVGARARLEERLREKEATLSGREATIESLVFALEKEKGRTQEQVVTLARQLVMHEKQLHARRGLEEATRNAEGRLTTRLARKIARARSTVPND